LKRLLKQAFESAVLRCLLKRFTRYALQLFPDDSHLRTPTFQSLKSGLSKCINPEVTLALLFNRCDAFNGFLNY
ncbi:MAG: hypothetical protein KGI95_09045, partial [Pseudomonas sp.]|nr:hypothetical protein [Pseudomonas sp.]